VDTFGRVSRVTARREPAPIRVRDFLGKLPTFWVVIPHTSPPGLTGVRRRSTSIIEAVAVDASEWPRGVLAQRYVPLKSGYSRMSMRSRILASAMKVVT
jgi:hypothetical protein